MLTFISVYAILREQINNVIFSCIFQLVLITPVCSLPAEVAHATLHGLGLKHKRHEPFNEYIAKELLFSTNCSDSAHRMALFDKKF